MADLQKAVETQLRNIESRTGKSLEELKALVRSSGLARHGEIVSMLKRDFGLGHGDANLIAHQARAGDSAAADTPDSAEPLDAIYTGPKASLRPIHDALLAHLRSFGSFETAPKQKYISYRRKRQFVMIGPATNTRVEVGLNIKELHGTDRLEKLPAGQMCTYRVKLTDPTAVDAELVAWMKAAYDAAG